MTMYEALLLSYSLECGCISCSQEHTKHQDVWKEFQAGGHGLSVISIDGLHITLFEDLQSRYRALCKTSLQA